MIISLVILAVPMSIEVFCKEKKNKLLNAKRLNVILKAIHLITDMKQVQNQSECWF